MKAADQRWSATWGLVVDEIRWWDPIVLKLKIRGGASGKVGGGFVYRASDVLGDMVGSEVLGNTDGDTVGS